MNKSLPRGVLWGSLPLAREAPQMPNGSGAGEPPAVEGQGEKEEQ